jgi:hypothetical protein
MVIVKEGINKIMYNKFKISVMFLLLFSLCSTGSFANTLPDSTNLNAKNDLPESIIVLKDGSSIYCRIIEKGTNEIYIQTRLFGKLTIPLSEISEIKNQTNNFWFPNPTDTRLFFAPTARGIKQGKGYFQDIYVFLGSGNYGIIDNLSIGGMFSFIPGIKMEQQVLAFTPKLSYEIVPDFNIAGGLLYAFSSETIGNFGLGYGLGTYGNSDSNITLGAGYGFMANKYSSKISNAGFIMLGGMHRVWEYTSLITENWGIFTESMNIFIPTFGVRFFGDKLSADLGLALPLNVYNFNYYNTQKVGQLGSIIPNIPILPYVDFVFSF